MKYFVLVSTVLFLTALTGCFGGAGPSLLGRMPDGYDMYITVNPETMDLEGILEALEDNLPEDVLEEIEEADLDVDLFDWAECKDAFGLQDGEIGLLSLTEDDEIVAFFVPCNDRPALEEFIEDNDFGDTEFFSLGDDYTVMVIVWDDDDLLDDLEEALTEDALSSDEDFIAMSTATDLDDSCINFFFSENVTDVPIYGALSTNSNESLLNVCVITDEEELELYIDVLGEGLLSDNIKLPENTMAAVRYNLNMNWLAGEYESIEESTGEGFFNDIEQGLPFIGFDSVEEFLSVFQGDFCWTIQEIELDENNELEGGAGIFAISLLDSETLISSISMISMIPEASIEEYDDFTAYRVRESGQEIWAFIDNDVLYVTVNVDPDDVTDGISAGDYFDGGIAARGFMGGSIDPEAVLDGIDADGNIKDIVTALFEERAEFSVVADGQMFTAQVVAGPDVLKSFVSLIGIIVSQSNESSVNYSMI